MKKSQLVELVKEELQGHLKDYPGHSNYYPGEKTPGLTPDVFNTILKNVALGVPEKGKYVGDPKKGHDLMNKVSQETIDAVINGTYKIQEGEGALSASEIKEFVKQTLDLRDYDVDVRINPAYNEIKLTIKQDPPEEGFNTILSYLEDNGYTINYEQTTRKGDDDGDRYYYPRIRF